VIIFALVFGASTPACAEMTLQSYEHLLKNPQYADQTQIYIIGVIEGLEWANAADRSENRTPLFCEPEKLDLTTDEDFQVRNDFIKSTNLPPSTYVGLIALKAFQQTFPCS